jgi:2-haloacid dehalogenase
LERYHEIEPTLQTGGDGTYRDVMAATLDELGAPPEEREALGRALPSWQPHPDTRAALHEARSRGWKLVVLSNTDRDFIDASIEEIAVPFEFAIVASEIGSYKPAHGHWERFFERVDVPAERHVHVAQSHFHDIVPAHELGLRSVWINRYGERHELAPTRELPDLSRLPDTLDELVAA